MIFGPIFCALSHGEGAIWDELGLRDEANFFEFWPTLWPLWPLSKKTKKKQKKRIWINFLRGDGEICVQRYFGSKFFFFFFFSPLYFLFIYLFIYLI